MTNKVCCFIGEKILGCKEQKTLFELFQKQIKALVDDGYNEFIFDGHFGIFNNEIFAGVFTQKYLLDKDAKTVCYAMSDNKYLDELRTIYDEVVLFEHEKNHNTVSINHAMIDKSHYCIFYVDNKSAKLKKTIEYAIKNGKRIVNLAL